MPNSRLVPHSLSLQNSGEGAWRFPSFALASFMQPSRCDFGNLKLTG
jgi:hypothetical protein